MSYIPGTYEGGPIELYLQQELQRVSEEFTPVADGAMDKRHVLPVKPRSGLFYADGSDWDPGDGVGIYRYDEDIPGFVLVGGTGLDAWELKTADYTLVAGNQIAVEATSAAATMTLPATLTVGDAFVVHNQATSTKLVSVDPATHSIKGAFGTVTSADTMKLRLGETAYMVAISTSVVELV